MELDIAVAPQVLYDARRSVLKEQRANQAEQLKQFTDRWLELDTTFLHNKENKFVGCYFFHTVFAGTDFVGQTLIMDDTSCTNHFGLPLVIIATSDEHNLTQIIAYALTLDRTQISFGDFLRWVRKRLSQQGTVPAKIVIPLAFVVDRHLGQLAALKEVFPESRIVFCRFHLEQNIASLFGEKSAVVAAFVNLMNCVISEEKYTTDLTAERGNFNDGSKQSNMIDVLLASLEHYSPCQTSQSTRHQASSIIESVNSLLKRLLEHKIATLVDVARAMWIISQRLFRRRFRITPSAPLADSIMTPADQHQIGYYALSTLVTEYQEYIQFLSSPDWESSLLPKIVERSCCRTAIMTKLPCRHLISRRFDERFPLDGLSRTSHLLDLKDIPERYLRTQIARARRVTHTVAEFNPPVQKGKDADWSYPHLQHVFEPFLNKAASDKGMQKIFTKFLDHLNRYTAAQPNGSGYTDSSCPKNQGQQKVRPCDSSLASLRSGKRNRKSSPSKKSAELPVSSPTDLPPSPPRTVNQPLDGLVGIQNLGASCYFNACMQCFVHLRLLSSYIDSDECTLDMDLPLRLDRQGNQKEHTGVVAVYRVVQRALRSQQTMEYEDLRQAIGLLMGNIENSPDADSTGQVGGADLGEAVSTFLGKLHDDLNVDRAPRAVDVVDQESAYWADLLLHGDTVVINLFWGIRHEQRRCPMCGVICGEVEPGDIFTVCLPPGGGAKVWSLEECIGLSTGWACAKDASTCRPCNTEVMMQRKTTYLRLPRVLIIQLVRFKAVQNGDSARTRSFQKDHRHVKFGLSLDMSPWVDRIKRAGCCNYDLHAVIQHNGTYDGERNHYIAGVRTGEYWHRFNDHTVTRQTPAEIQNMEAYCLVYVQRQ
jgi:ubiquitin C-terminal hydrolase